MHGMKYMVRTLDAAGLPSPHLEVWFDPTQPDGSQRRMTVLFLAALIQGLVPVTRRWGTIPVPPDGEAIGRVVVTNVVPAEVPAARELLVRFVAAQVGRAYDPDTAVWVTDGATAQARDLAVLVRAQVATVEPAGPDGTARRGVAVAALARAVDAAFALGCARAVGADAVAKVAAAGGTISVDATGATPRLQIQLPRGVAWRHGRALALALLAHVEAVTPARERWVVSLDEPRDIATPRWRICFEGLDDAATLARARALLAQIAAAA